MNENFYTSISKPVMKFGLVYNHAIFFISAFSVLAMFVPIYYWVASAFVCYQIMFRVTHYDPDYFTVVYVSLVRTQPNQNFFHVGRNVYGDF